MQNEYPKDIAFVKCGIVDKLAPKSVCQKVAMVGTRTFRIPYQAPHPYLDWAHRYLLNLTWDKYVKHYEGKFFAQSLGRTFRESRTYQMESK